VPPILHVCHQAREEGLKYYTACLEKQRSEKNAPSRRLIYANFVVVYFVYDDEWDSDFKNVLPVARFNFDLSIMGQIRRVAIFHDRVQPLHSPQRVAALSAKKDVKDLTVIMNKHWLGEGDIEHIDRDLRRREMRIGLSDHVKSIVAVWRHCAIRIEVLVNVISMVEQKMI